MNVSSYLRELYIDLWHGAIWKVLAVIAKAWFLFVVFPKLSEGSLGEYVFITTVSMIVGRSLVVGFDVQLPLLIRGRMDEARRWLVAYAAILITCIVAAVTSVFIADQKSAIFVLTACYAGHALLSGIVRSVNPASLELLGNLHTILFAVLVTLPFYFDGTSLAYLAAIGLLLAQVVVLLYMGGRFSRWPDSRARLAEVGVAVRAGASKLVSNLTLALALRGIVIWPVFLAGEATSDTVGFAVGLGEGLWQLGMILVNRSYARFCGSASNRRAVLIETMSRSALFVSMFAVAGFLIASNGDIIFEWLGTLDWIVVGYLVTMYGMICCLHLIRYAAWSQGHRAIPLVVMIALWVVWQAIVVVLFNSQLSVLLILAGAAVALAGSGVYLYKILVEPD